jgi:nitronate monooxygenase
MREIGPMNAAAPAFPLAFGAIMPLRARAEGQGSGDFTGLWAGQHIRRGPDLPAAQLTRELA